MTRKDYVAIAAALNSTRPVDFNALAHYMERSATEAQWQSDCEALIEVLATDNPRFDRDRFLKACGIQ